MEFGKRHDTTDTTDFCPRQLVTDLSFMLRTCCGLATGKWCNEFWYLVTALTEGTNSGTIFFIIGQLHDGGNSWTYMLVFTILT